MGTIAQYGKTSDTDRHLSPRLWGGCPDRAELEGGPRGGFYIYDDFTTFPVWAGTTEANHGQYQCFSDTGGTILDGAEIGGVIALASDGDNEGSSIKTSQLPFKIIRGGGELWFECRIKTSTIADTKHGIFVGLIDTATLSATVPIAADGTLADENFVGFHRLEGDGDYFNSVYKANGVTQVTVAQDAKVIVADTYVKLGMHYNPVSYVLTFFADGTPLADTYTVIAAAGTDFPNDVQLGLVCAVLNATGSTPGSAELDWWKCCQLATL